MHTKVLGLVAAGVVGLALFPAVASATTSPESSVSADQSALNAYHTYLSTLTSDAPAAAARDDQLVDGVANTCADALTDLNQLSATQLKKSALTAFGNEVDADLDLAYVDTGTPALNKFAAVLDDLSWSTPTQLNTTLRLISGERALLGLSLSHICPDAISLDAAPLSEPTATQHFLNRYNRVSTALSADLSAFQTLLAKFETTAESKLVAQINALVSGYSTQSAATEQADADSVLSGLGVTS